MNEILSILKELAESNTVNFIIMTVLLVIIVKKLNLGAAFEKSIEAVKSLIEKSEREKEYGSGVLKKQQDLTDRLPEDLANLERTSDSKIRAFKKQIETNTKTAVSDMSYAADRIMSIEEKKISNLLTVETSAEAVECARKRICGLIESNPGLHDDFIRQSLDELEKAVI